MTPRVSDSEFQVLLALWDDSPQSASEISATIARKNGWTHTTVKTLLARLVQKSVVRAQADGRRFLYSPLVPREKLAGAESQRLVDRLFGGRVSPLFAHLAEREALSDDDIAEIEAILQKLKS